MIREKPTRAAPDGPRQLSSQEPPAGKKGLFLGLPILHTPYQRLYQVRNSQSVAFGSWQYFLINLQGYFGQVRGIHFGLVDTTALAFDYQFSKEQIQDFSLDNLVEDGDGESNGPPTLPSVPQRSPAFQSAPNGWKPRKMAIQPKKLLRANRDSYRANVNF